MRITKDTASGALFAVLGGAFLFLASGYRFGTISGMGPGFFPLFIAGGVVVLGLILLVRGILFPDASEPVTDLALRPLFAVVASVVAFGFLIDRIGLVASVIVLVVLSRLLGERPKPIELIVLTAILLGLTYAIFIVGLNIPIKLGF